MNPQKTPRRKHNARHQVHNSQSHIQSIPVQASDYESEAYIPSSTEKRSNAQINFSVLQRYIPNLRAILAQAPSTQIYTFSPETHKWEKINTEGTLFVCELTPSPLTGLVQHCVMVLNRRGLDNLIIESKEIENVEATEQFLLVTLKSLGELKTLGFYMYEDETDAKSQTCQLIMETWEKAMREREQEDEMVERIRLQGPQAEEMVKSFSLAGQKAMGRRLSLTELFGQQR